MGLSEGNANRLALSGRLLAALGGVLSVVVARLAVRVLVDIAPGEIPRLQNVQVGGEAMLFLVALTMVCGVSLGLLLAFRASRGNLQLTLRAGGRGSFGSMMKAP